MLELFREDTKIFNMVLTTNEIIFSRTFPRQQLLFLGQSIQDLKVINQDMCKTAYHIYSMYGRLLTFYGTASSSPFQLSDPHTFI